MGSVSIFYNSSLFLSQKFQINVDKQLFSTQPPEPEILLDILNEKTDDKDDAIYGSDEDQFKPSF